MRIKDESRSRLGWSLPATGSTASGRLGDRRRTYPAHHGVTIAQPCAVGAGAPTNGTSRTSNEGRATASASEGRRRVGAAAAAVAAAAAASGCGGGVGGGGCGVYGDGTFAGGGCRTTEANADADAARRRRRDAIHVAATAAAAAAAAAAALRSHLVFCAFLNFLSFPYFIAKELAWRQRQRERKSCYELITSRFVRRWVSFVFLFRLEWLVIFLHLATKSRMNTKARTEGRSRSMISRNGYR